VISPAIGVDPADSCDLTINEMLPGDVAGWVSRAA
jgi:hypothetical protein